jgi:hypothetical protein
MIITSQTRGVPQGTSLLLERNIGRLKRFDLMLSLGEISVSGSKLE